MCDGKGVRRINWSTDECKVLLNIPVCFYGCVRDAKAGAVAAKMVMKRQNLSSPARTVESCANRQVLSARTVESCENRRVLREPSGSVCENRRVLREPSSPARTVEFCLREPSSPARTFESCANEILWLPLKIALPL